MIPSDHFAGVAYFLPDESGHARVEIFAVGGTAPSDPENGDAEYYKVRCEQELAWQLHRAFPTSRIYSALT